MHTQDQFVLMRRRDTNAHLDFRLQFQPAGLAYSWDRPRAEQALADIRAGNGPPHFTYGIVEQLEIYPTPICGVCGAWSPQYADCGVYRCYRHLKANACVIDGCSRFRKTEYQPRDDWFMCSTHWRAFVPPKSAMRRIYNRVWRLSKQAEHRGGARHREMRVWRAIVRRARQAHSGQFEGFVDEDEINKMFGWT